MASPRWKVYSAAREYRGCLKHVEDAAPVVALLGYGATIRDGHRVRDVVWREGYEEQSAGESYDFVAAVAHDRARRARAGGR